MSLETKIKSGEFVVLGEFEPPKGADFSRLLKNAMQIKGRVDAVMVPEMGNAVMKASSLGCCAFLPWSNDQKIELVRTITGWHTDMRELMRIGERSVTLARVFNMREGLGHEEDVLPGRMNTYHVSQTINEEPVDPEVLDEAVSLFYGMMGWDTTTGEPTESKLQELDIEWVNDVK